MQYRNRKKIRKIRGTIYDRNSKELALSVDVDSVYMNPSQVKKNTLGSIAELLKISKEVLEKKAASKRAFAWVKRKITPDQTEVIKRMAVQGIYTLPEGKRFYPRKELAGQLLGFTGLDHRGLEGVEVAYERYLSEGSGLRGHDVKLTMDNMIQFVVEEALVASCTKYRAKGGQVLVMDPNSGRILAMAVYPRFDPNRFRQARAENWRNRCLTDGFEPGSIFKVFLAAAALEEGLFTPDQRIFCENGEIKIKNTTIHDWKPYGWLKFREVLEKSSNIGSIKIGMRLGKERLYDYLTRLGFGKKTGIGLFGEGAGGLKDLQKWSAASTAYYSIGQGLSVTSVQYLRAFCAIANGGMLPEVQIVEEIWDPESGALADFPTEPHRERVFSRETSRTLASILQGVVEKGTGRRADIDNYTVAGKTGTAQKFDTAAGKYFENRYVASFAGFTPVSSPRLAILVVIDEPRGRYHGGEVAAPVFARIARQVLEYLQVRPDEENVFLARPHKRKSKNKRFTGRENISSPVPFAYNRGAADRNVKVLYKTMPDLKGKSMRQVIKKLSGSGLYMRVKGSGFAVSQNPPVGGNIPRDRICTVEFRAP